MRTLRVQHTPYAIGQRCEQTLIVLAVARITIGDAEHGDRFIVGHHRHGDDSAADPAIRLSAASSVRSLLEVACRTRTHSVNTPSRAQWTRLRSRPSSSCAWRRSRQAASVIVLSRGIDEEQISERTVGDVGRLFDHATHDRGLVEGIGLLEQIDQELELALLRRCADVSRRRCDTSRISSTASPCAP